MSRRNVSTASRIRARTEPGRTPDRHVSRLLERLGPHRASIGFRVRRGQVRRHPRVVSLERGGGGVRRLVAGGEEPAALDVDFPRRSWSSLLSANDAARGAARSMGAPPSFAVVVVLFRSSDSVFAAGASRSSARPCLSDQDLASAAWSDKFRIASSRFETETPAVENSSASEACAASAAASRASNLAASAASAASAAAMTAAPSSAARPRSSARIPSTSRASSKNTEGKPHTEPAWGASADSRIFAANDSRPDGDV